MQVSAETLNLGEVTDNFFRTGNSHYNSKQYQQAVDSFDAALRSLDEYQDCDEKKEAKKTILRNLAVALDSLGREYYRDGKSQNVIDTFQKLLSLKTGLLRDNCYLYQALALEQFGVSYSVDGLTEQAEKTFEEAITLIIEKIPFSTEYLLTKLSLLYAHLPGETAKFASLALGTGDFNKSNEEQLNSKWSEMTKDRNSTEQTLVVFDLILNNLRANYPNNSFKKYLSDPVNLQKFEMLVKETRKLRELQFIEEVIEVAQGSRVAQLQSTLKRLPNDIWLMILAYVAGRGLRTSEQVQSICLFLLQTIRGTTFGNLNWSTAAKTSKFFKEWQADEFPRINSRYPKIVGSILPPSVAPKISG